MIRNESNSYSSDSEDFTLLSRIERKREREPSELEVEGSSPKRIRKSPVEDDDFLEKEAQVFRSSVFTSPFASQPRRSCQPASSLADDFEIYFASVSSYQTSGSPYRGTASEKAEITSDGEPAPAISTPPPGSPEAPAAVPNFASPAANAARKIFCPPAPKKSWALKQEKRVSFAKEKQEDKQIFFQNALKYQNSLSEVFQHDPRILGVALLPGRQDAFLGQGEFVNAYSIRFKADAEAKESVQVVKIHHLAKHISQPSHLVDCLLSEIEQYIFLKDSKFPVANFFNFDEFLAKEKNLDFYRNQEGSKALKDHLTANFLYPFYRVEYVPYAIANTKEEFESRYEGEIASSQGDLEVLSCLLEAQQDPLCQVKRMFEFAWREDVCLDLGLGNLRIRKGGEVVLSDLYYDRSEEFSDHIMSCLRTFVSDIHSPLLDYLVSSLPEEGKQRLAYAREALR